MKAPNMRDEHSDPMPLNEENYKDKIQAFTSQDWQPLLDLIPEIERTAKFSKWKGGEIDKDGVLQMPYVIDEAPVLSQFRDIVYKMPIIIDFDWGGWDEGRKIASDESFDYDTLDIPTKCKLITAFVRNDRFCEGALVGKFESGLILKILKSIEKQVACSNKA